MPKLKKDADPKYRLHRRSGQAMVTLSGLDFSLGAFGSDESKSRYNRLVAKWRDNGRVALREWRHEEAAPRRLEGPSIETLVARYREHLEARRRNPDGTIKREVENIRDALGPLREVYGTTAANEFNATKLEELQKLLVNRGLSRKYINRQIARIKALFKFGKQRAIIKAEVWHSVRDLEGLKEHEFGVIDRPDVESVPDEIVAVTLEFCPRAVRDMIQVQRLSGARPGEITSMRVGEIDRTGEVWIYQPIRHKTAHKKKVRRICFGPKAQAILLPYLRKIGDDAPVFDAADASPKCRRPGGRYRVDSYRRAIYRATDKADRWAKGAIVIANDERLVPRWHPNQLRHSAATEIERKFSGEASQHVLGHSTRKMTETYLDRNTEVAARVAREIG
jgi:integrase